MNFIGQKKDKYFCRYCGFSNSEKEVVLNHVDKHELILIPIAKKDMNRLNQFFFSLDTKILPEHFVKVLQTYIRQAIRNE